MSDAVEAVRQNVDEEPADELACCQAHDLLPIPILDSVVFPPERDCFGISADQAIIGDRDPMGIA